MERRKDKIRERVVNQAREMMDVESRKAAERYLVAFGFAQPQILRVLADEGPFRPWRFEQSKPPAGRAT